MKEKLDNTYLPPDEATKILSGEVFDRQYLTEEEWLKMKPIFESLGCLKEENVKEGD
ncbi:hypothetical protein SOX05_08590 [Pseudomonas putida]|nr:hypothetical protein [Pseudomonas putida]MDY4319318.1 hypothetical protein [Pseudomonas putida]MDY4352703.1 hypothetical protein [Pseudomonas putida]